MKRSLLGTILWGGVLLAPSAHAQIHSAHYRAQLFQAADGQYKGIPLTATEKGFVQTALHRLASLQTQQPAYAPALQCLQEMLTLGRIGKEAGTSRLAALSWPDLKKECTPQAEAIQLANDFAQWSAEELAAVLVHQVCHLRQTGSDLAGDTETACWQAERDCLLALGQDVAGAAAYDHFRLVQKQLQERDPQPPRPIGPEPRQGSKRLRANGEEFALFTGEPLLYLRRVNGPHRGLTTFSLPAMTSLFDLLLLEEVGSGGQDRVVLVSGLNIPTDTGRLVALKIQNGQVTQTLYDLALPGIHPFALAYDRPRKTLFLLDTAGKQILRLTDGNNDGVPETPAAQPFATQSTFPELANALGLAPNTGSRSPSLLVDGGDTRDQDVIRADATRWVLSDSTQDGVAESSLSLIWRAFLGLLPGFAIPARFGDYLLEVVGGEESEVKVFLTNAAGTTNQLELGSATIPVGSNSAFVVLSQPLECQHYIKQVDASDLLSSPARRVCADVRGKVTLMDAASYVGAFVFVELRYPSDPGYVYYYDFPTDNNGQFSLPDVAPGLYHATFFGDRWLHRKLILDASSGAATNLALTLIPGDANQDNHIDIFDLATLAEAFNTTPIDFAWRPYCDFNNDQSVDIFDLAILAENFNTDGDP